MFERHSKRFRQDNMTECNVWGPRQKEKHLERAPEVAVGWWVITPGVERGPCRPNSRKCAVSIDSSLGGYVFITALSWDYLIILLGRTYAPYKQRPKHVLTLRYRDFSGQVMRSDKLRGENRYWEFITWILQQQQHCLPTNWGAAGTNRGKQLAMPACVMQTNPEISERQFAVFRSDQTTPTF